MAEACGNRTHLARVRRHAGFEDQEGHQAQSASTLLLQRIPLRVTFSSHLLCCRLLRKYSCVAFVLGRTTSAVRTARLPLDVAIQHGECLVSEQSLNLRLVGPRSRGQAMMCRRWWNQIGRISAAATTWANRFPTTDLFHGRPPARKNTRSVLACPPEARSLARRYHRGSTIGTRCLCPLLAARHRAEQRRCCAAPSTLLRRSPTVTASRPQCRVRVLHRFWGKRCSGRPMVTQGFHSLIRPGRRRAPTPPPPQVHDIQDHLLGRVRCVLYTCTARHAPCTSHAQAACCDGMCARFSSCLP